MSEQNRPLKVFLCHTHSDKDADRALYDHTTSVFVAQNPHHKLVIRMSSESVLKVMLRRF